MAQQERIPSQPAMNPIHIKGPLSLHIQRGFATGDIRDIDGVRIASHVNEANGRIMVAALNDWINHADRAHARKMRAA
jgi:hypothetical protein